MTYKVLVSDNLSDKGVKIFQDEEGVEVDVNTGLTPEELKKEIKKYDALIIRSATKATAEWFPPKERATAVGYFNSGSMIGAFIAPPLVAFVTHYWGWQEAFVVTGAIGFIWFGFWYALYHLPEDHPRISAEERDYIKREGGGTVQVKKKIPALRFFKFPETLD